MSRSFLFGISLLAISVYAPQPAPAQNPPAGSPANTTTIFDGAYSGTSVKTTPGPTNEQCANVPVALALNINNGTAQFRSLGLTFHGYVTTDGKLSMRAESGQTFEGQFSGTTQPRGLTGRIIGKCIYDATWIKEG